MNNVIQSFAELAPRIGQTVLHSIWEGGLIALLLWAVLQLLDRSTAQLRYLACCAAMLLLVAGFCFTFVELGPGEQEFNLKLPVQMVHTGPSVHLQMPHTRVSTYQALSLAIVRQPWSRLVAWGWLIGAIASSLWRVGGWLWLGRLASGRQVNDFKPFNQLKDRLGIASAVRLFECARLNVPAVMGVFSPVVLVPIGFLNELSLAQVEAILAHELAHVRRHDYLVNLVQCAIESMMFYNPGLWWISAQIRLEREYCCDDVAALICQPRTFAGALLALEERLAPPSLLMLGATGGSLMERVQRLLSESNPPQRRRIRSIAAAVILLAIVTVLLTYIAHSRSQIKSSPRPALQSLIPDTATATGILPEDQRPGVLSDIIAPGDLLRISIGDLTGQNSETEKECRVSDPAGTVSLPYLKDVKVSGGEIRELAKTLAEAYRHAQILSDPRIQVERLASARNSYSILGQDVDKPGRYTLFDSQFHLTDAFAVTGTHPGDLATIVIVRKGQGSQPRTLNIPAHQLLAGDARVNVFVQPGDTIMLHDTTLAASAITPKPTGNPVEGGEYYLGGADVQRAGVFSIPSGQITLKQAIIAAGGLNSGFIRLLRREGSEEFLALNNAAVPDLISGKQNDVLIHANDIVTITPAPLAWEGSTTTQPIKP